MVNHLKIPSGFSDIFYYNPSKLLLSVVIKKNIEAEEIYKFQDRLTNFKFLLYKKNAFLLLNQRSYHPSFGLKVLLLYLL